LNLKKRYVDFNCHEPLLNSNDFLLNISILILINGSLALNLSNKCNTNDVNLFEDCLKMRFDDPCETEVTEFEFNDDAEQKP
jgi:hypothetical protein